MEERKDIKWYEWLYQVSNLWNVKRLPNKIEWCREIKEHILKPGKRVNNYLFVRLSKEWTIKIKNIHRLVAEAFIPNIENKEQVNHKNWIKIDNRAENLERNTPSENMQHCFNVLWNKIRSKWVKYSQAPRAKKVIQYLSNWIKIRWCVKEAGDITWISCSSISECCRWKRKTAWWYKWKYEFNI